MIAQPQFDAQLRRVAVALDTSVEDLLLHAPDAWDGCLPEPPRASAWYA